MGHALYKPWAYSCENMREISCVLYILSKTAYIYKVMLSDKCYGEKKEKKKKEW